MSSIAILNARLIDPASGRDEIASVLIEGGMITDITSGPADWVVAQTIDADGLVLSPGLIDMRVVTGEPGAEHKETLASAGKAAAAGGVTSMVVMPSTNPVIDDISLVDHIQRSGHAKSPVRVYVAGALTTGLKGEQMTELGMMSNSGALMFSNGDTPISNAGLMRRIMAYSSIFNALITHRPVDADLSHGSCAHESDFSFRLGLRTAPSASERITADRDLALAELTGARFMLDQISSLETLPALRRAKDKDMEVYGSVSINHLALNELDIGDYRTFAKLAPPLRSEADREALVAAINDGVIDVIVSAHDPRPAGEKRRPYAESSPGAVGLEILLSAGLTLVADGQLDLHAFLASVTINPAEILGLPQGRIKIGAPADLVLFDLERPWMCNADALLSLSHNTPFDGRHMQGKAVLTVVDGKIVFDARRA